MKRTAQMLYMLYMLCALCFAQAQQQPHTLPYITPVQNADLKDKLPTPHAPQKIQVPSSPAKDALYSAIHKKDQADKAASDLNVQVAQLQQKIEQQAKTLDAQQKAAQQAVDQAQTALLKEMKLDPEKFSLNPETMEATAKAEPLKPQEAKK